MVPSRENLLARVVAECGRAGLRDRSLRELAAAAGTSHRMLLYHFGSREGLVAAVVASVEAAQRQAVRELARTVDSPSELIRALWRQVAAEEMRPFVRLFFELVGHGPGSSEDQLTAPWLEEGAEVARVIDATFDPVEFRLGVAVTRGLLIDIVMGGDVADATASLERFIALWEAGAGRS